jgi:AcrR family transcriptional regulator
MRTVAKLARGSSATIYKHFSDKADLFTNALESEYNLHAHYPNQQAAPDSPSVAVAGAVFAIGAQALGPNWAWMHSLMMASELSGADRIAAVARQHRQASSAHVASMVTQRSAADTLSPTQRALIVNQLLGGVERSGLLAMILFGKAQIGLADLARQAKVTAADLEGVMANVAAGFPSPLSA